MLSKRIVFKAPKEVVIEEVDVPAPSRGQVLVKTLVTLISTGTELTMLSAEFSKGQPGVMEPGWFVDPGKLLVAASQITLSMV